MFHFEDEAWRVCTRDQILAEAYRRQSGQVDLEGNPVKYTKQQRPYCYSEHVVGRLAANHPKMSAIYTDRMWSWDREKTQRLMQKHLSESRWQHPDMFAVQEFMAEWLEDPKVQVIAVMEWCNAATGFPTWSIHYVLGEDL